MEEKYIKLAKSISFRTQRGQELSEELIEAFQIKEFYFALVQELKNAFLLGKLKEYVPMELSQDKKFATEVIKVNAFALVLFDEQIQNDKDIVLLAVTGGCALCYVSEKMKDDEDVVRTALNNSGFHYRDASLRLRGKKEFLLLGLQYSPEYIEYAPEELKDDKEFILETLKTVRVNYKKLSIRLQEDRDIALAFIKKNPLNYAYLPPKLKNDVEICAYAAESTSMKKQIPLEVRLSSQFMQMRRRVGQENRKPSEPKEEAELKLTVKKVKGFDAKYEIEVVYQNNKYLLKPQIDLKTRFVFAIEDWVQIRSKRPINRILTAHYKDEINKAYNNLPDAVKEVVKEDKFYKEILKKLKSKEKSEYQSIRFAFRKDGDVIKAFTFYSPFELAPVFSMLGYVTATINSWYTADLYGDLEKRGIKNVHGDEKVESRSTDEASYFELEEMNYIVLIKEIDVEKVKSNPKEAINSFVNEAFKQAEEEFEKKISPFDINEYSFGTAFEDKYQDDFSLVYLEALKDAR